MLQITLHFKIEFTELARCSRILVVTIKSKISINIKKNMELPMLKKVQQKSSAFWVNFR